MKTLKTFKDLVFLNKYSNEELNEMNEKGISYLNNAKQAVINFENGYGASIITGFGSYTDEENPYELAVLNNNEITYCTEITDDVIGYLTARKVTNILKKIQKL